LFGCDLCQEACPWDRFAAANPGFATRLSSVLPSIEFLSLDDAGFRARFAGTALRRAGRNRMARNAAVVLGNTRPPEGLAPLTAALDDASPLVRGHVAWALGRYGALPALAARLAIEQDGFVRGELEAELGGPPSGHPAGARAAVPC
jgi:epoxyqueuosine reductase